MQTKRVNRLLQELGLRYHDGLPISEITEILIQNGLPVLEDGLYCGHEGKFSEPLGKFGKRCLYLHLSWYRMPETGRYEIVAYVN
jgi:hypothetical protein